MSLQKIILFGLLLAVFSGYGPQSCFASLVLDGGKSLRSISDFEKKSVESVPVSGLPIKFHPFLNPNSMETTMSGSSGTSGFGNHWILIGNHNFDLLLTHSEKVFLSSWIWLPNPPFDDLLKVPISNF